MWLARPRQIENWGGDGVVKFGDAADDLLNLRSRRTSR